MLKPRGQTRPRSRNPLASASSFWSWLRSLIFNFKEPGVLSFRNTALFGHYRAASQNRNASDEPSKQLSRYIILINSDSFDSTTEFSALSKLYSDFALLQPLFQRLFCVQGQFCSSRESLLWKWTYHVFTPSTHVKCCVRLPVFKCNANN